MTQPHHEGRHSGSRPRHSVPPGDEGDAERDASRRRQAGHPVRRRRGRERRPHRCAHDHRPQQERPREPLRPGRRTRGTRSRAKGDTAKLEKVNESTDLADMHYVRQGDPQGLGHAVLRARMHVGNEPFAVLLGDDIIDARDVLLTRMLEEQGKRDASIVALLEVDPDSHPPLRRRRRSRPPTTPTSCASRASSRSPPRGRTVELRGHRPLRAEARGVRHPRAHAARQGRRDPAHRCAHDDGRRRRGTGGVYGVVFRGRRYDTGDKLDYIKAVVQLASDRDDLGPELRPWLIDYAASSEGLTMRRAAVPTLRDGDVTLRPIRARDAKPLEKRAHRQPQLAAPVGGDVPRRRNGHRHAGEHPQPARARSLGPRAAVHHRGRRRAGRAS